ncbi:hypothetical protein Trydic_g15302 [Trypoxylus dichotomus]
MTRLRRTNLEGKKGTGNNSVKKGRCKKNDNHLLGKVQQVSNYCLRGNKNTAFKDKLLQVPVVVLDKYSIPSTLLEKLCYPGDIVFDHKMTSTSSTNNSYVGSAQCLESNKPNSDRMKCIQSFKITAQLNEANSRKIDIIPLPIETTVSMHYEQPKTSAQVRTVRKRLWCLHNDEFKEDYLRSLCNITSSNSIFRNAFLEHEISSRPVTGTRLSLSRTVSNASLNTISNTDVWVSSKARSYEHQHCDTSKYYSTKKVRLSFEEYDCPSKDGTLVRSDSSGYHSEQKLSDNSSSSSIASSPKRQISSDYVHNITVTVNCSQEKIPKLSLQHSPNHVTSSKRRCDFKTPKLPLFKRPPTRIKPNVGSTVNSSARSTSSISVMSEDNSDTISLFAETICYDLDNDDNQNGNRYIPKKSVSTPILRNDTTDVENKKGNFIVTDRILQSSNTSKQDNLVNKPHYAEQLKQNNGINDHELTIKVQETEIYVKSGETTSYTSTNESSSSSDNSEGIETSQIERNKRIPNLQEQRECINPEENEAPIDEEEEEDEDGTEEEESEGTEEETETNNIEQTSHIFQLDLPLQKNHNYTNSEVDTYLNSVNRDLYSLGNYYTMSEPPIKRSSIADKENYKSLENERSIDPSCSESPTPSNNAEIRLDLSDSDIVKLVASTNKDDISAILSIMKNSADNNLHRPFTIHMLTALKKLLPANAIKLIVDIFQNLGNLIPHILHQAPNMKHIMRLLAFNVLPYLDKRKEYGAATRIIDVFSKEIDEFIKTESITQYEWLSSTKLRYIFIFKIFVRDKKLREALKLLKNSSLALFQNLTTGNELEYKQRVLNEFMETALQTDLQIAKEGILYLMLNMDSLQNIINLGNFLNQLLVRLLNFYSIHKYDVLGLIDNIVNGWFKHLKHSVMRALLVQTFYDLPEQKVLEFFHLCVEVGVYRIHDGFDNSIEIPRNLLPEEILFVLHIHFHKISHEGGPFYLQPTCESKAKDENDKLVSLLKKMPRGRRQCRGR